MVRRIDGFFALGCRESRQKEGGQAFFDSTRAQIK